MKPDSYMPFYGNDFFQAVAGLPDNVAISYLRCCWYYWTHDHCRGLRNDPDALRRIAQVDRMDWADVFAVVFDNDRFFTLGEDGLWHQKRCDLEWAKAIVKYKSAVDNGRKGAEKRWKSKSNH